MTSITRDIIFDDYGDFRLENGDIEVSNNKLRIFRQNVIDRIKSNRDDYRMYSEFGANLQSLIGKPNSIGLEAETERLIKKSLTSDGFVANEDIKIVSISTPETIVTKLEIATLELGISVSTLKITAIYNTQNGSLYAY